MQRAGGGGMKGYGRGSVNPSIKNRLGFQSNRRNPTAGGGGGGGLRVVSGGRIVGGGSGRGSNIGIKSRLGPGIIKRRSVASVAIGEIVDARQKINFKRVQTGRVGDARQKIEEKRRKKAIISGKLKNLRITTPSDMIRNPVRSIGGGFTSRTGREIGQEGLFRSAMDEVFSYTIRQSPSPSRLTRTIGGGGGDSYPTGMRIAPPSDDFMLTRTIRNPNASYGSGGRPTTDYSTSRSQVHGIAKIEPIQYSSPSSGSYSRSAFHDQPMDQDMYEAPIPSRRAEYSNSSNSESQSRILVSNLQLSVTADDIVELFSDIGPLFGARMTAPGQAEVTYTRKADALKAIEAYHNRLLDGSAMRVFLDTSRSSAPAPPVERSRSLTALKSASGASMKLPTVTKSSSGIKIQPDISAIHKVLFNPGSSGTRGLFKGGQ